jgi:hypothetical protein
MKTTANTQCTTIASALGSVLIVLVPFLFFISEIFIVLGQWVKSTVLILYLYYWIVLVFQLYAHISYTTSQIHTQTFTIFILLTHTRNRMFSPLLTVIL